MNDQTPQTPATTDGAASALTVELGPITREAWMRRYAAQVMKRAGWTQEEADEVAAIGAQEYEANERAAGNAVVWWGGPSGADNTPEDEADEEMSYWTDDGE